MDNASQPQYDQQNDEIGMPPTTAFTPDHKKRNRIRIICAVVILLLAGGAIWWFLSRDKPAQKQAAPTPSAAQQQAPATTAPKSNILFGRSNQSSGSDISLLNVSTEAITSVITDAGYYMVVAELPNGTVRVLSTTATQEGGNSKESITVRDGNGAVKTLYSAVTSNNANTISKILWPSALNADGSKAYFYERDNIAKTQRIASVDMNGSVTDIATYKDSDGKAGWGQFKGILTPGHVSKDEKTIYFHQHSCLNCDGPQYADIVTYDVPSKTFKTAFADPAYETSKAEGYWTKLSDDYFVVRSNSLNNNFAFESYEDTRAKSKDQLYLFDLRTGQATKVFDSNANHFSGWPLNISQDGKTFYYYTEKIVQESTLMNEGAGPGHTYHYTTNEIRGYNIAANKTELITLSLDPLKQRPIFLTSNSDTYLYGVGGRTPPFSDTTSIEPYGIFSSPKTSAGEKKTLATYPAKDVAGLSFLAFSAKQ